MEKVLYIVLQNFKNDSRVLKQCSSLIKHNYKVSVVALHEDGLEEKEIINDIYVHRIKLKTKKWPKNIFFQILKYLEFSLKTVIQYKSMDIINASSFAPLPLAIFMRLITFGRIKVIYDARELESQTAHLRGTKQKLLIVLENLLLAFINNMSTVSRSIGEDYVKRYSCKMPYIIMNCPPIQEVIQLDKFRQIFGISKDKKIFIYQGGLNKGRGIELLIESFAKLTRGNVVLIVMGYGTLEEYIKGAVRKYENIFFHGAVPPNELLSYTASADIGIILTENSCLSHYYSLPNKLFEYGMAGLPIIASDLYELNRIISTYNCGVLTELNVNSVVENIEKLLDSDLESLSINARKMAVENSWEEQEKQLLEMYKTI